MGAVFTLFSLISRHYGNCLKFNTILLFILKHGVTNITSFTEKSCNELKKIFLVVNKTTVLFLLQKKNLVFRTTRVKTKLNNKIEIKHSVAELFVCVRIFFALYWKRVYYCV